jgi:hypothetical protein
MSANQSILMDSLAEIRSLLSFTDLQNSLTFLYTVLLAFSTTLSSPSIFIQTPLNMPATLARTEATENKFLTPSRASPDLPIAFVKALAKLRSGSGGRPRDYRANVPWNLDCQMEAEAKDSIDLDNDEDDDEDDDESVASEGSSITVNDLESTTIILSSRNDPASSPANAILALQETPEKDQKKKGSRRWIVMY